MDTRKIAEVCSYIMLLDGSLALGFLGRTTEMGLAIGAGAIGLAFLNLEQIASLKGARIELITKDKMNIWGQSKNYSTDIAIPCDIYGCKCIRY